MSILQFLAEYIPVFYGLLGLATIWLAYEIRRAVKERRKAWPTEEWTTPSPEQAWKEKTPQVAAIIAPRPPVKSTADTDPLKQFFQKEHVTEPITTDINRRGKRQA